MWMSYRGMNNFECQNIVQTRSPANLNYDDDFSQVRWSCKPEAWRLFTLKLWNLISIFIGFLHSLTAAHFTHTLYTPCMSEHIVHADVISVSSRVNDLAKWPLSTVCQMGGVSEHVRLCFLFSDFVKKVPVPSSATCMIHIFFWKYASLKTAIVGGCVLMGDLIERLC